jgi:hypothetical protein
MYIFYVGVGGAEDVDFSLVVFFRPSIFFSQKHALPAAVLSL